MGGKIFLFYRKKIDSVQSHLFCLGDLLGIFDINFFIFERMPPNKVCVNLYTIGEFSETTFPKNFL